MYKNIFLYIVCDKESLLRKEIEKLPALSIANSLVQIPTEHPWPHGKKCFVSLLII